MDNCYTSDELYHWGIKGMKWGIRRYQNKDGSLTPAGQKRYNKAVETMNDANASARSKARAKNTIEKLKSSKKTDEPEETVAEKRARLLKSTDAKEIYENRDLLTTTELNDRIYRIDTEARLKSKIVEDRQQTGTEYVNSKMKNAKSTIDNVNNLLTSVDNAYKTVSNSAIGKALAKQLGLETPKKEFNLEDVWKNRNKLSSKELSDASSRVESMNKIEGRLNKERENAEKAQKEAQKQVDAYIKEHYRNSSGSPSSSVYSMTGDEVIDNKVAAGRSFVANRLLLEDKSGG